MEPVLFRWLGVAGIELRVDDQVLAIDPFFTRPPLRRLFFGQVEPDSELIAEHMERCDDIVITHAHWDHVMDVPELVRSTGATAWGSANACRLLAICGVPAEKTRVIHAGDALELGPYRVQVIPAKHRWVPAFRPKDLAPGLEPPLRLRDYQMEWCFSVLVAVEGLRLLNWRSVDSDPAPRADVLFVGPHDGRNHYQALLQAVQPRLVIPVHWDDFFRPLEDPIRPCWRAPRWALPPFGRVNLARLKRMIQQIDPQVEILIPEILHPYDLRRCLSETQRS
ncbi:MAG: MBL fold metallo-hydrolase [Anaerolineae bacterium]